MLRDIPIHRKLITLTLLVSGVAVFVSCMLFLGVDFQRQHLAMIADLDTTAEIVGSSSIAELSSDAPAEAKRNLEFLKMRPHIVAAALYDRTGLAIATYRNGLSDFTAPPVQPNGNDVNRQAVKYFHEIRSAGQLVGTLYLQSDMVEGRARLTYYLLMLASMLAIAFLTALTLSRRLHKVISAPIFHLASVVKKVGVDKSYATRAVKHGNDELGQLIDGFNEMLSQLQQHEAALKEAHDALERRVEERTRELASSVALLNATLESTADGIIAVQASGHAVCHNGQFRSMWGIQPESFALGSEQSHGIAFIAPLLKDQEQYKKRIAEILARMEQEHFDVLELQDGRIFERYIKPQKLDGHVVGRVINFRDVTARRDAEQKLEKIHRELLEASRQAGMAEVATNVLHNVGNVLNSINVSAELLADTIKSSKVSSLAKLIDLLRDHAHELGAFIANDPKGRLLPGFLTELCERLLKEQRMSMGELEVLRSNITHVKEIVAMQQSYSKLSGHKEQVSIVDLIEDSLRMNEGALQRHGVEVSRDYAPVAPLNTERHKVLQILVNLIRNAKYACSDSPRQDKKIVIRVVREANLVKIAVIDNGVGISADNLVRIFGHGFTTRKDGHGYGLHSGALTARELGGALRVHSDGPGLGASFTLELPVELVEAKRSALSA